MSNSQLNKLKSGLKSETEVTLNLAANLIGNSNDETNTLVSRLRKAFANNYSPNIKLSKTELYKIGQSGGFLRRPLRPLLKIGLPLIGNVLKPLAKSVLIPLGLTAAASATDAAILKKKMFGSGVTTLMISNDKYL